MENFAEALECYDQALKYDPGSARLWCDRGMVLGKSGNYHEALKCFDSALELDAEFKDAKELRELCLSLIKDNSYMMIIMDFIFFSKHASGIFAGLPLEKAFYAQLPYFNYYCILSLTGLKII